MAQVPEKVLAWLHGVLHEYRDPQRAYSDIARTLSTYPSISPRTEVYTYENGASALLLTLAGTLPVAFRGTTYRFPVKLWVPQAYPQEAPIVFVNPGTDMLVRPGQHVSIDGRVYHPYLRDWTAMWDRASIAEFMEFLQQVFAKEPPVISKAQQQQYQRPIGQFSADSRSAPPQLPPKQRVGSVETMHDLDTGVAPPRPPKPGEEYPESFPARTSSRNVTRDGPPLPPLPPDQSRRTPQVPLTNRYSNGYAASERPPAQNIPPPLPGYAIGSPPGPPLPAIPQQQHPQHQQYRANHDQSPVSPVSPVHGYSELPETRYSRAPPLPPQQQQQQYLSTQSYAMPQPHQQPSHQSQTLRQPLVTQRQQPLNQYYPQPAGFQQAQPNKAPPRDLLSDPFEVALPGPAASGPPAPAPPIPPNPEKEHLLHAISTALVQQAQQRVHQNLSAIAPLQAQQNALRAAHARLEAEIRQLEQLSKTLDSNESILRRSIQDCDTTISHAKSKKQPPVDEVLIAPTMVANQLWTLSAEEAACKEAMYVLQKAVDRGRVSGEAFVRQMRGLGREAFLKMVLARKCARGLGLEMSGK